MPEASPDAIKTFFCCTGVGILNRGIESFFREAFDGLHDLPGFDITLYKGRGETGPHERRLWCIPKTSGRGKFLAKLIRREPYVVEQLSSLLPTIRQIRKHRPRLIFTSDPALSRRLSQFRRQIGVDFRIVFSNGFPLEGRILGVDYIQQVVPYYYDLARQDGVPAERMITVPYGITVPSTPLVWDPAQRRANRHALGLPEDRPLVLSVGWISAQLKRMDYTIRELAALPQPRPFLVMLGAMDKTTPPIIALAEQLLGQENFAARSVPYPQVRQYYEAADVFVLSSIREGFGRVYLEALMHGLPCVVNDHAVTRYVLGDVGFFADLTQPGALAARLAPLLGQLLHLDAMQTRREHVRTNFSWPALRVKYAEMFHNALRLPPRN